MTILFWLAVLPGLFLIYRVYRMDKVEKEPLSLLLLVTVLGMISVFPAGVIEDLLGNVLAMLISPSSLIYVIIENFLVVALIEEVVKFFVLERCTWDNPAFDYEFDGIVYAICSGMGFAIAEPSGWECKGTEKFRISKFLFQKHVKNRHYHNGYQQ